MNNWKSNGRRAAAAAMTAAMLTTAWAVPVSADEAVSGGGGTPANVESAAGSAPAKPDAGAAVKTAIGKTKAEQLLRQYVNIPKEYELQGASSGTSKLADGTRSYWSLTFVKRVNGKQRGSIHASLDASTGQLLSFSAYSEEQNAPPVYPLKVDREDAKGLAATFIGQVAADYKSEVKLNESFGISLLPPLTGSVRHTLRYERVVNGIVFPANYIQVEMDSDGHVQGFELNWDETIEFPKAGSILSAADGLTAIREAAEPQLRYIVPYNASGERKPTLSYALPAFAVDASTGERAAATDFYGYNRGTVSETPLSDKPLGAKPKGAKLTEEAARAAVETSFELPTGYELDQSTYNEYKDELTGKLRATWDLNWTFKKDGRDGGGAWANVDAETGIIRSFYGYGGSGAGENASSPQSVTLESAIEKAKETVRKQLPWLTDELYVIIPDAELYKDRKPEEIGGYSISFEHQVHGAVADYDRVSVAIDAQSGKVQSFEASTADYAYPAKKPSVLSEAEAVDLWLDYYESKLQYRMSSQYWWDGQPLPIEKVKTLIAAGEADGDLLQQKVTVELVYQLAARPVHEQVYLDAVTGEWRSAETGEKAALELPRATDAEGHWAEQSLQLMVAYKALDLQDGKVRPNEAITRGELIKMLVLASSGGRYGAYDALASGTEAKAMFNDVAADSAYFSYVQTAVANNLIDVGDGSFNPDGKVSRDEMSELIVRALGYNSLANYDHMFKASFKDEADIDNKGQAAIVVGLKIMSLADGRFLPDKQVTRAEASIAFYRYLQKRAELQESPLRM